MLAIRTLSVSWGIAAAACQMVAAGGPMDDSLARALKGRVARAPVECVERASIGSTTVVPGVAILYNAGNTIYVNRPGAGSASLEENMVLVDLPFPRLCRDDVVELVDGRSGMPAGVVFLGDFVPYGPGRRAH